MWRRITTVLLTAAYLALGHPNATAAEREWVFSVGAGAQSLPGAGVETQLGFDLGLSDFFWLHTSLLSTFALNTEKARSSKVFGLFVGPTWVFDVFRTIPFLEANLGILTNGDTFGVAPRFGGGFDYLLSPHVGIGLVGRYLVYPERFSDDVFSGQLRLAFRGEL